MPRSARGSRRFGIRRQHVVQEPFGGVVDLPDGQPQVLDVAERELVLELLHGRAEVVVDRSSDVLASLVILSSALDYA